MENIELKIYGQTYRLRGVVDPEYVQELGAIVDHKMRAIASETSASDVHGLAVLAALNLADELKQALQEQPQASSPPATGVPRAIVQRLAACNRLLDDALA